MGAGGKFDPAQIQAVDIAETNNCRLAYYIRKSCTSWIFGRESQRCIHLTCFQMAVVESLGEFNKRSTVGTISYMPAIFGCVCASVVLRDLLS